jgi:hypothetical protein
MKEEITDFETSPIGSNAEGLYVCEETFANWQVRYYIIKS